MKISVCLPVFDRAEMLGNALETILEQTHSDWEVVLKDGCLERPAVGNPFLKEQFKRLGPRLRYMLSKDGGIFPALNEALRYSTGDVLHFMCSDDGFSHPDVLDAISAEFSGHRDPYWCYGQTQNIDVYGNDMDVCGAHTTLNEMLICNQIGQPSVFWNRHMFKRASWFDYAHAGDYDMWLRFWRIVEPKYMPRILGKFRKWPNQSTAQHIEEVQREADSISQKHIDEIERAEMQRVSKVTNA
jgi:glycosyltransferase involved in cell wall biosynthesis